MTADLRMVAWNMAHRAENWMEIGRFHVALLTEAVPPPHDSQGPLGIHGDWVTAGSKRRPWSTAIAWNQGAPVQRIEFAPSRAGTLSAIVYDSRLVVASCYATWEPDPDHPEWPEGRSDRSALALVDDLARLQREFTLPVVVAGDWNLWPSSYPNPGGCSVITPIEEKMREQGIRRVPLTGERVRGDLRRSTYGTLPDDAIPTYDHQRRGCPRYEVDHVFASETLTAVAEAWNSREEWGPSDHCRIAVSVQLQGLDEQLKCASLSYRSSHPVSAVRSRP